MTNSTPSKNQNNPPHQSSADIQPASDLLPFPLSVVLGCQVSAPQQPVLPECPPIINTTEMPPVPHSTTLLPSHLLPPVSFRASSSPSQSLLFLPSCFYNLLLSWTRNSLWLLPGPPSNIPAPELSPGSSVGIT